MYGSFYNDVSSSYAVAVTPHDTTLNVKGAKFIQNTGTAGVFTVRQNIAAGKAGVAATAAATVIV